MESRIGLEYIVENSDYTAKLAKALDCDSITVKKQVFELLSALCVYNSEGYARALQALEQYKDFKSERYRLKLIVDELGLKENPLDYKTTLLAFVNCLVIATPQLKDRVRIRNEFIGLKLLAVLDDIRRYVNSNNCTDYADLGVQLDVFQEQRENDEAQILDSPYGVDLNSHVDVFYAILRQVAETPQEIPFLSILQHLLRIDPKEAISDIIWDTAEKLVHRATLLESRQDATRVLRSPSVQSRLCCYNHRSVPDTVCGSRKQSLNINIPTSPNTLSSPAGTNQTSTTTPPSPSPPPPPPPPSAQVTNTSSPPPPPPPPPPPQTNLDNCAFAESIMTGTPPPPTPPLLTAGHHQKKLQASLEPMEVVDLRLPQQETPTPKTKMKTINWNKIPNNKVIGRHNIWSVVARSHQHSPMADLDWSEMEGLFCQQAPPSTVAPNVQCSPKLGSRDPHDTYERRKKEPSEIILLDGKRSLNVNIFLKQFRCSNEDIIQLIKEGGHDDIGAEKLRGLLKMLPGIDELEMLKAFDGDKSKLANAEKFLLELIAVPNYKLRIESMLLKEEFPTNMSYLEPTISSMIVAGEDLMTNKALQEVLYMVICAGNFLNSGGYAGNAAGVKLTSLQKLTDIRANKPGMNLIHYVAMQIEKKRQDLMKFADDMTALDEASKTTVEQLQNEVQALDNRIQKIKKQVDMPTTETEIKNQMRDFLKMAEQEVNTLKEDLKELENVRKSLADFFCEDTTSFKIEECFKIFHGFCVKFKQAIAENERRHIQEEQANARRKQREEQLAVKKRTTTNIGGISPTGGTISNDNPIMDILLNDIQPSVLQKRLHDRDNRSRKQGVNSNAMFSEEESQSVTNSPIVSRRRLGSFSGDPQPLGTMKEDICSPDVTPTGSLRRRRSRVPSEEDETALMDFLRTSEQESLRERKSWGSLDRSWARRARGGSKRRPDLLNADFCNDRERPASPSSNQENKPFLPASEEEVKPKAWRQKIEAWLHENEKEEKQIANVSHKTQRRPYNDRKYVGNDSESEGRDPNSGTLLDRLRRDSLTKLQEQVTDYKRVYSDWKPTIDKTDVMGTMEAIADIEPQSQAKDKSMWRKSQLNTFNPDEAETDARKLSRMRSRGNLDSSPPLEAIKEEEKKKVLGPYTEQSSQQCSRHSTEPKSNCSRPRHAENLNEQSTLHSPESELAKSASTSTSKCNDYDKIDKIEIDSDNIETPPATRKLLGHPRGNPIKAAKFEEETLGDGLFDRFSSMRRTRRYRRAPEEEVKMSEAPDPSPFSEEHPIRPTTLKVKPQKVDVDKVESQDCREAMARSAPNPPSNNTSPKKEIVVRNKIPVLQSNYIRRNSRLSATLPYSFKNPSPVSTKLTNVRESNGINVPHPNTNSSSYGPEIKVRALTPTKNKLESASDLHDEGFEETQSLISDSPSQTTLSGYNYDLLDNMDSPSPSVLHPNNDSKQAIFSRTDSCGSGDGDTINSCVSKVEALNRRNTMLSQKRVGDHKVSLLPKRTGSLRLMVPKLESKQVNRPSTTLSRSINYKQDYPKSLNNATHISPPRCNTLMKTESKTPIQRCPSKSSLRSSRSSLNSCTSISTVKTVKPNSKIDNYSNVIKSLASLQKARASAAAAAKVKKPLTPVQANKARGSGTTIPSRSSSSVVSGSESANAARRNRLLMLSVSFKENSAELANEQLKCGSQSFMRPTASSSARDMTDSKPKLAVRAPFK